METKKLEVGEKYLTIKVVGHNDIVAFPNKAKTKPNSPDYVSNGVKVWVNTKKEPKPEVEPHMTVA